MSRSTRAAVIPLRTARLRTPHRLEVVTVAPRPGWYPDPAGATGLYRVGWQQLGRGDQRLGAGAAAPVESEAVAGGDAPLRRASPVRVVTVLTSGLPCSSAHRSAWVW